MELDPESLSLEPRTGFSSLQGGPGAPVPTTSLLGACWPPYIFLPTTLLHPPQEANREAPHSEEIVSSSSCCHGDHSPSPALPVTELREAG